mgnify:CR=1 FL=1
MRRLAVGALGLLLVLLLPVGAAGTGRGPIAVIGDFGDRSASAAAVARLVADQHPTAVVTTGDNIYGRRDFAASVTRYYGAFMAPTTERNAFWPATGNHDYSDAGMSAFRDAFPALGGKTNYARTVDGIEFIVLDSTKALGSAASLAWQRVWAEQQARHSAAAWQVIVLHHPPFSSGLVHGSSSAFQWPYRDWGVDLVLAGHDHEYERVVRSGVTYVVEGSSGAQLYGFGPPVSGSVVRDARDHGALFLRQESGRLVGEYRTTKGTVLDRFVLTPRG